jgi:hypothetical protein
MKTSQLNSSRATAAKIVMRLHRITAGLEEKTRNTDKLSRKWNIQ